MFVGSFLTVVRTGSIRAAASELGLAQSAISRQLQMLEHQLGAPVLERNTRGVRLTPAGDLLHRRAQDIVFRFERFQSELDAFRGKIGGRVQFSAIESLASHLLPVVLAKLQESLPAVTVAVTVATTQDVVRQVREGLAEFGICFRTPPQDGIEVVARCHEPLLAALPRGHALAGRDSITLADLQPYPLALSTRHTGLGLLLDQACQKAGIILSTKLETNSIELLRRFVGQGCGIAVMTREACIEALEAGEIAAVPLEGAVLADSSIDFITVQGRSLPIPAERVMAELRNLLEHSSTPFLQRRR